MTIPRAELNGLLMCELVPPVVNALKTMNSVISIFGKIPALFLGEK